MTRIDPFRNVELKASTMALPMVAATGVDLARVLHNYYVGDRERFDRYEESVRTILPDVEMIETPLVEQETSVTVSLKYAGDPTKYNLWQISSGLKDILVLLAAIHFSEPGAFIMIEEPENHLHPASQKALCSIIRTSAEREKKQFLLTTHSEAVLSQSEQQQVFILNREGSSSIAVSLGEEKLRNVYHQLGVEQTSFLQILARKPQIIVILEGRNDAKTLEAFWKYLHVQDSLLVGRSEGGGYQSIVDKAAQLKESLNSFRLPTEVFVVLDNDNQRDQKITYLGAKGFPIQKSHVWEQKELESYLVIPPALEKLSCKPSHEVNSVITGVAGSGKERLAEILTKLSIPDAHTSLILTSVIHDFPASIPADLKNLGNKLRAMLNMPSL